MQIDDVLRAHGGTARWAQLKGQVSRRTLRRAVASGAACSDHGTFSLPPTDRATRLARRLRGTRSHRSAAQHWGLALPPRADGEKVQHDIAIPRNAMRRNVPDDIRLRYLEIEDDDDVDGVLSPVATVAFCLRDLSLREALSIGDSALNKAVVSVAALKERIARFRGPGAARAAKRLQLLDGRAANAFESSCRAVLIAAGISGFEPQVDIRHNRRWVGRVDLAHRTLRVVIECEGFETHGTLAAMTKDCVRHTLLVAAGWRPLRFTWHQVMFQPDWLLTQVRDTLEWAGTNALAS